MAVCPRVFRSISQSSSKMGKSVCAFSCEALLFSLDQRAGLLGIMFVAVTDCWGCYLSICFVHLNVLPPGASFLWAAAEDGFESSTQTLYPRRVALSPKSENFRTRQTIIGCFDQEAHLVKISLQCILCYIKNFPLHLLNVCSHSKAVGHKGGKILSLWF